jgi:cytochrome c553
LLSEVSGIIRLGALVLGIIVALGLAAAAVFIVSERKLNASVALPNTSIAVPSDIASVQRGQHIVGAIALCTRCHGSNLAGMVVLDDASARIVAPNLTRGGVGATLRTADMARAIRDGIDPSGHPLWLMPSDNYHVLSDADLAAVLAYLQTLPSITNTLPTREIRPLGRLMLATGQWPLLPSEDIDRSARRAAAPPAGVTPEYGSYLASIAGCADCHGPGLSGGAVPGAAAGAPPAANLTPAALGSWSEADFLRAMRTGRRPDNQAIDTSMPWPYYAQMSDTELRALWQFLQVIPALPTVSH